MSVDLSVAVGTKVRSEVSFVDDLTDEPADPTVVKLKVRDPSTGTTTTITYPHADIERIGVGVYRYRRVLASKGTWWFQWRGEGAGGPEVVKESAIRAEANAL